MRTAPALGWLRELNSFPSAIMSLPRIAARSALISAVAAALLAGCSSERVTGIASFRVTGTVQWAGFCWTVRSDEGQSFEVDSLPSELATSGTRVRLTARERRGVGSVCMAGTLVEVITVSRL